MLLQTGQIFSNWLRLDPLRHSSHCAHYDRANEPDRETRPRTGLPSFLNRERLVSVWHAGNWAPSSTTSNRWVHHSTGEREKSSNRRFPSQHIMKWVDAVVLKRRLCKRWVESSERVACATETGTNVRARTLRMMGMSCPQFNRPAFHSILSLQQRVGFTSYCLPTWDQTLIIAPINESALVTTLVIEL